jgi:hypothetical protein
MVKLIAGEDLKAGEWVYIEPRDGKLYRLRAPTRWSRARNFYRWVFLGRGPYNYPAAQLLQDKKRNE